MPDLSILPAVVVHGGAGGREEDRDGCVKAAQAAFEELRHGHDVLAAVSSAVATLEDDGRFNAGTGSVLCLDGATVEMDASVMDNRGRLGAVACLRRVRNPVLVALSVSKSPHWLLCGEGAARFARVEGFEVYQPVNEKARKAHADLMRQLAPASAYADPDADPARVWPYLRTLEKPEKSACDTVGAVARDGQGHFAVAASTGGCAPSLLGRVGDTPIVGSGFYAGPFGAVAATGIGEKIVRHLLANTVYRWIANGTPLHQALQRGIDLFDNDTDVGLIAVSRTEAGSLSNRPMPAAEVCDA